MTGLLKRSRNRVRPLYARAAQPVLEGLEGRVLLYSATGDVWPNPSLVTYSFMPDGTNVGGVSSNLFATLNAYYPTATWENIFAKAAASWEEEANVNLSPVSDDGLPEGSGNYIQGSPNFGDIRIGAIPMPAGDLAYTLLSPPTSQGSVTGDIFFNSNVNWSSSTGYDLLTVALHEFGHAAGGLGESTVTSAVMYADYEGVRQALTTDDIQGIQSVYGARVAASDTSYTNATSIALNGAHQAVVTGVQIAGPGNTNWYSVVVPSGTSGTLSVTMQSSNLSLLEPSLTLYNSNPTGLAQVSTTSYGGTVTITLTGVSTGQLYYIRAGAATNGPGSGGAYGLSVNAGTGTMPAISPPNTVALGGTGMGGSFSEDMNTLGSPSRPPAAVFAPVVIPADNAHDASGKHSTSDVVRTVVVGQPHPLPIGRSRGQGTVGSPASTSRFLLP